MDGYWEGIPGWAGIARAAVAAPGSLGMSKARLDHPGTVGIVPAMAGVGWDDPLEDPNNPMVL